MVDDRDQPDFRVVVRRDADRQARLKIAVPATATIDKPSCFGGDSEDLQVTVTALAATGAASASDFTLTRDGGW